MKQLAILLVAVMMASCTNAQKVKDKEVPAVVKSALQKSYPNAKELSWEKENGNHEASFEVDDTDYSLLIDTSGNILETEVEINIDELPAKAKEYISQNHAGQKIKEAAKITDSKGVVTYEAEIKGKDLIFDSNGDLLK
ncbi:MAG: PepSY-like domain-containing protein [Cyclobacteriaceae bacterium]|nr:PepSY-like domain-containing protein [Cyclobacteriaceae bacterium]